LKSLSDKVQLLYVLIMAIPLTRMIENVSTTPEHNTILRAVILLFVIVEWIYSQASFSSKHEYSAKLRTFTTIIATFMEVGLCISLSIAAYNIGSELTFYSFVLFFFTVDLILQVITRPPKSDNFMRKVTKTWIVLDTLEMICFSSAIVHLYWKPGASLTRSIILTSVVTSFVIIDFIRNYQFYFGHEEVTD
jgi:hypothetical protein